MAELAYMKCSPTLMYDKAFDAKCVIRSYLFLQNQSCFFGGTNTCYHKGSDRYVCTYMFVCMVERSECIYNKKMKNILGMESLQV
jgi:hypothetical protein